MKEQYRRPELIEYGRLEDLTLGQTGNSPDHASQGGYLINNICDPSQPHPGLTCS